MPALMTELMRVELEKQDGGPVTVLDEITHQTYYLVSAKDFDRLKTLLSEEPFQPQDIYPLISRTALDAGWNDPLMDEYDNYDQHRSQG